MKQVVKFSGKVTAFNGNGRQLGYPTANLSIETELKDGIYFGFADLEAYEHHPALIFLGTPLTVGERSRRLEVHLLDIQDKDYYGQDLEVELWYYHRPVENFGSTEELTLAMQEDEQAARKWFDKA